MRIQLHQTMPSFQLDRAYSIFFAKLPSIVLLANEKRNLKLSACIHPATNKPTLPGASRNERERNAAAAQSKHPQKGWIEAEFSIFRTIFPNFYPSLENVFSLTSDVLKQFDFDVFPQSPPPAPKTPKSVSDKKRFFENAMEDQTKQTPKPGKWRNLAYSSLI